jgi:hypothetical protein
MIVDSGVDVTPDVSRFFPMSRPRWICLGALLLVLAVLPFLPHGGGEPDRARRAAGPESSTPLTAGYGRVTPASRRTIADVVSSGRAPRITARTPARTLVGDLVRCAVFEGQRYCLGSGWTDRTQAQVQRSMTAVATRQAARPTRATSTGDLSMIAALHQAARMATGDRAAAQTAELTEAARSVAKVWLLRHQIQGVALPPHFFARHPEVRAATGSSAGRSTTSNVLAPVSPTGKQRPKGWDDYPSRGAVLDPQDVRAQHRTYWCGPTSMQMITWGWSGHKRYQQHWATKLGTTTSGTSITSMVDVVNRYTGWDKASYAGPYITLDISDWSFRQWMLLMARHIVDYRAPVILHPVLLTQFYPYLDHDGSGHFQVGRGYRKRDGKTPLLGYFEPWNQQRFHPDEPFIDRVQWRNGYRSYRANQAHFQHNLGV